MSKKRQSALALVVTGLVVTALIGGQWMNVGFAKVGAPVPVQPPAESDAQPISLPVSGPLKMPDPLPVGGAKTSIYTNDKFDFSFEYATGLRITEWEPTDEILYSASITNPALDEKIPFQPPETSVSVFAKQERETLTKWLKTRTEGTEAENSTSKTRLHILYSNLSPITSMQIDEKPALVFRESTFGSTSIRALVDQGAYILSVSLTDPTNSPEISEYFLNIASSLQFKSGSKRGKTNSLLKTKLAPVVESLKPKEAPVGKTIPEIQSASAMATAGVVYSGYKLPWQNGVSHVVTQDWVGGATHIAKQAYAYDFNTKEGEQLRAARSGIVGHIVNGNTECGGKDKIGFANYVTLDHADGKSTLYLHMQSVSVSVGQSVRQGDIIGYSGKTGYTNTGNGCGAHLHFQRQEAGGYFTQSIAVYFDEYPEQQLYQSSSYTSQNTGCVPPNTGTWTVSTSCEFTGSATAPSDVVINSNVTLTIAPNGVLDINLINNRLLVKNGGKVIIRAGGKIY